MQKHWQVMYPSPAPRRVVRWRPAVVERRTGRRGDVGGVAARPSAGCAGSGCGAERREQEGAA